MKHSVCWLEIRSNFLLRLSVRILRTITISVCSSVWLRIFIFPISLTPSTGNCGICMRLLDVIPRSLPSPTYVSMKENYKMGRMFKVIPTATSFMKVTFSTFVFSRHLMFSQLFFIICVAKEFRNTKMNWPNHIAIYTKFGLYSICMMPSYGFIHITRLFL